MSAAQDTTTLRTRKSTRSLLEELATRRGISLIQAQDEAAQALWREDFFATLQVQLAELRSDPRAWRDYLADAAATEVDDGLE